MRKTAENALPLRTGSVSDLQQRLSQVVLVIHYAG